MVRAYLLSFLAGLVSALMFATYGANLWLAMLVVPFAPLPLFAAGLSMGLRAALFAGVAASLLSGMVTGSMYFALAYAASVLAPAALLIRQGLLNRPGSLGQTEWYPLGRLMALLAAFMSALFLIVCALLAGAQGGITGVLIDLINQIHLASAADGAPLEPLPADLVEMTARRALVWSPGLSVLFTSLCLIVTQGALVRFGKALRPPFDLVNLSLPLWLTGLVIVAGAVALAVPGDIGTIGSGVAIAAAAPFLFLGLAVIHTAARRWSAGIIVLIAVYGLLLFVPAVGIAIVGMGLLERWLNLRARLGGPSGNKE